MIGLGQSKQGDVQYMEMSLTKASLGFKNDSP